MKHFTYLFYLLSVAVLAQTNTPTPNNKQPQTATTQQGSNIVKPQKVFMPNSEYKRIGHTGTELPHTKSTHFSINEPTALPPQPDAQIVPAAPKYRRSTAQLIQSLQGKLDYLKTLPTIPANKQERASIEQQLFEAYQRLSYEKECPAKSNTYPQKD